MEKEILVSIVVPVYNAEKYLEKCLNSIRSQTYKTLDIVLVDDGSTDRSSELCDSFAEKDSRIKVIHKKNGGLVSAWKAGLSETDKSSSFVVFIDADDWIEEKHIECMAAEQMKTDADIVVVRMKQVYSDSEKYIDFIAEPKFYKGETLKKELYPIMLNSGGFEQRGIPVSRCSKLIRKRLIFNNLKYSNESVTYEEDLNIMFPVFLDMNSISLIVCDNSAYCYKLNNDSMLHDYDKNMTNSIQHVYPALRQAYTDKSQMLFQNQVDAEYLSAMIRACTNELQNPLGFKEGYSNVRKFSCNHELKRIISELSYSNFPIRFKLVIAVIRNTDRFWAKILFYILGTIKKVNRL